MSSDNACDYDVLTLRWINYYCFIGIVMSNVLTHETFPCFIIWVYELMLSITGCQFIWAEKLINVNVFWLFTACPIIFSRKQKPFILAQTMNYQEIDRYHHSQCMENLTSQDG